MKLAAQQDNESRLAEDRETATLVARIHAGETELFTALYERYFDRIYAYLCVMMKDTHEAEDLTQQVFVRALGAIGGYRSDRGPFRAWLFVIARNCALSQLRSRSRTEPLERTHLENHVDPSSFELPLPSESWLSDSDLLSFVERLPVSQRQVLVLRFMLDLSAAEVGQVLDLDEQHVRVLQHRALRFLEERLSAVRGGSRRYRKTPVMRWGREATILRRRRFALLR